MSCHFQKSRRGCSLDQVGIELVLALAHADDGDHAAVEDFKNLAVDGAVVVLEDGAALRMTRLKR